MIAAERVSVGVHREQRGKEAHVLHLKRRAKSVGCDERDVGRVLAAFGAVNEVGDADAGEAHEIVVGCFGRLDGRDLRARERGERGERERLRVAVGPDELERPCAALVVARVGCARCRVVLARFGETRCDPRTICRWIAGDREERGDRQQSAPHVGRDDAISAHDPHRSFGRAIVAPMSERPYVQVTSEPTPLELGPEVEGVAPPDAAVRAAIGVRRAMKAATDRLAPADLVLWEMVTGVATTKMLGAAARLRIADLLAERPLDGATIADKTGQNADVMHRMMRALVSFGVFTLTADARFENNFRSEALRSGRPGAVREFIEYFATRSNVDAWNRFDETLATGKNGFAIEHGMSVWDWFDAHPGERALFATAMMGMTVMMAPVISNLYPWGELGTVCDVGGGRGTLLSELLLRFRSLRGVLYDGEGVVELGRELLQARGVMDRATLEAGSFFERVPSGADAFILKNILHDWDDAACKTILGNVRTACKVGQKVVILEMLLEHGDARGGGPPSDVHMMMVCDDGRERGRGELGTLLAATGFRLGRIQEHALISAIEGIAA